MRDPRCHNLPHRGTRCLFTFQPRSLEVTSRAHFDRGKVNNRANSLGWDEVGMGDGDVLDAIYHRVGHLACTLFSFHNPPFPAPPFPSTVSHTVVSSSLSLSLSLCPWNRPIISSETPPNSLALPPCISYQDVLRQTTSQDISSPNSDSDSDSGLS